MTVPRAPWRWFQSPVVPIAKADLIRADPNEMT